MVKKGQINEYEYIRASNGAKKKRSSSLLKLHTCVKSVDDNNGEKDDLQESNKRFVVFMVT